jgi:hypothetical protein
MSDSTAGAGNNPNKSMEVVAGVGAEVLDRVQDVLKGGKIRNVRIKLGNRTIREIPVEAAAFTAILLAAAAVILSQLHIELDKG